MTAKDRKLAIVKAALPLFARKGFAETTTKELARAAKVSEPLLGYCAFTFWNITSRYECVRPGLGSRAVIALHRVRESHPTACTSNRGHDQAIVARRCRTPAEPKDRWRKHEIRARAHDRPPTNEAP